MKDQFSIFNFQFSIKSVLVMLFFLFPIPYSLFPTFAQQATLSLSPSTGTFNRSCTFSLDINLNTGSADTDGTDAILIYDSSRFSATSISNGTVYSEYPGNNIDDTNGKITISGLASVTSPFTGSGKLATVNFLVKEAAATGATQITFDFNPADKAKTTDSNVVQRGTVSDILNSVVNGSYTIGSSSCANPSPGPGTGTQPGVGRGATGVATPSGAVIQPTPTQAPVYTQLPNRANTELTFTIAIVGSAMVILGVLGLALL